MPFLVGLLGAVVASFVGVIAERIHTGHSFISGRSRCNSCARVLEPLDLVPVMSWLMTFGRCRTCKARVPAFYAGTEILLALCFLLAYVALGPTLALIAFLIALGILMFIVVYDLRHTIVPPEASLLFAFASLSYAIMTVPDLRTLGAQLMIAALFALGFLALHVCSGGRAMGLGDAPIVFSLALLAGPYAFGGLLLSFWIGALFGIGILVTRRGGPKMGIEVPFVPFLAAGFLLAYFLAWNPLLF